MYESHRTLEQAKALTLLLQMEFASDEGLSEMDRTAVFDVLLQLIDKAMRSSGINA
jgi:hypothetical protein